jgi:hypothetical protein
MNNLNLLFVIFLLVVFLVGLYIYSNNSFVKSKIITQETLDNISPKDSCPDLLIDKGNALLLYNTKQPEVSGVNPIPFNNLDEYINYLEIQNKKGKKCPVLYLQKENNAQGKDVYRVRPSPFNPEGGLPTLHSTEGTISIDNKTPLEILDASRDNPPYNAGNYSGFDPQGLHIGTYTVLDEIHDSTKKSPVSDNPIDTNWGGVMYTQQMIESGKYDENNIYKPNYVTPKGTIFPDLYPNSNYPRE